MKFDERFRGVRVGTGAYAFVPGPNDNEVLCDKVFSVCRDRGWSLSQLSEAMGISQSTLSKVMHSKWVGVDMKKRVAACFCCRVEDLFP